MKVQLTKAQAFELKPGKKYAVFITTDVTQWTKDQQDKVAAQLGQLGMAVTFLPKDSKFKIVEQESDDAATAATKQ